MRERRQNKLTGQMRDLVAEFIERISDRSAVITLTRVNLEHEGKLARCYISVLPVEKEKVALGFAKRHVGDLREYVAGKTKTRFVPKFEFLLDFGEKNRQRIEELLKK